MLIAILLMGMGEELWTRFIPKYLQLLGAGTWIIAIYGTIKDLLDGIYQYPGGWLTDHLGRRKSLVVFTSIATVGYLIYLFSPSYEWILFGTIFVMAWSSLTLPAFFAIIGDNLPQEQRSTAFGVQAFIKRIPIVIAPAIGGWLIVQAGFSNGISLALALTIVLSITSSVIVLRSYRDENQPVTEKSNFKQVWGEMDPYLKKLLVADCFARWAEGIPKVFIVLYVLNDLQASPFQFGLLTSIQTLTSMAAYIPFARMSDKLNRKPFVLATFIFFALFPLVLVNATSFVLLIIAFITAGLREIGEPARKAQITDLAKISARGRTVGMYYLVRGISVFPASIVGGWLWSMHNTLTFYVAFGFGVIGCIWYALQVKNFNNNAPAAAGKS
ncbi:MAG: MFS transporter [Bacteroidetes bacterium]|nr:MAG: MFS transporter [Bacteroidota bacterium]